MTPLARLSPVRPRPARLLLAGPLAVCLSLAGAMPAGAAEPQEKDLEAAKARFFENEVRPLLAKRCFECHGEAKQEGELRLDSMNHILAGGWSGAALERGKPNDSLLMEAVRYESYEMPPSGKLPAEEIAVLARWIELGAPWPGAEDSPPVRPASERGPTFTAEDRAWWALQPVVEPEVPATNSDWGRNDVDRFLLAQMEQRGLTPAPEADRLTLIHRLTQDLTGLPPTPEEVDAFVADESPGAYDQLVDRLLASDAYGERWGRHWLDLVRYADSDGYRADGYRSNAWRYRDYVIESFNEDKPYDTFVKEQLAADELYPKDVDAQVALGYLRHGIYEYNSREAPGQRELMLNELTDTTADVFLGLGLQCAKCHDHKFDPLPQTDYYRLRAFLEPVLFRDDVPLATEEEQAAHAAAMKQWEEATADLRAELEEIEGPAREKALKSGVGRFPEDVQAIYYKPDAEKTAYDRQVYWLVHDQVLFEWNRLDNRIPSDLKPKAVELRKKIAEFDHLKPAPLPTGRIAGDADAVPPPTVVPKRKLEVQPGKIALLSEEPMEIEPPLLDGKPLPGVNGHGTTGRRTALAKWITDPENPLSTRVIVNRVWQGHFGRGLAPNGSDFGRLGGPPSHPELLDWLVVRFLDEGWRLKPLHRLIVSSAAYRQAATHPQAAAYASIDPQNDWYWRADVRRLAAEQVRDALLSVTGSLREKDGGPGAGHGTPVRSVYLQVKRNSREPLMDLFDLPQFFISASNRDTTTSPLQSLYLINSDDVLGHAAKLAARVSAEAGSAGQSADGEAALAAAAWRAVLGREPTDGELASCVEFLREQARRAKAAAEKDGGEPDESGLKFADFPTRDGRAVVSTEREPAPLFAPHVDRLGDPLAGGGFTVEAFFQIDSVYATGSVRTLVSKWNGGSGEPGWGFGVTGKGSRRKPQTLVMQMYGRPFGGGAVREAAIFSDQHIDLNKPYYVAAAVVPATEGQPGTVTFILKDLSNNDVPLSVVTHEHPLAEAGNATPVAIGRRGTSPSANLFDGLIDEVRLSRGALGVEDALITDESPSDATLAHWTFEKTPGPFRDAAAEPGKGLDLTPHRAAVSTAEPRRQALVDLCHVLLNSSEFLYVQ
ncbi:DUF1549 domain-containing protein [Alienimonas californiensis]|uniref:Planctomycete cytochrome C n=1 Tax=Alienimonas californiensis TaxID=2527989 RepID=A0A517PFR0_9PLAN|nr:DUF1549 domain-containing protein [Alienimonas californiensis]QDT18222.1 Planctomycete cytochrome C [Alienimonas californiensis]